VGTRSVYESDDRSYSEEELYLYRNDRLSEVQRTRNGHPQATYWLSYDGEGRITRLFWWGRWPSRY